MVDLVTSLGAAAGTYAASQSAATNVEDVFSTYLYTGDGNDVNAVDNGVALANSIEYAAHISGDGVTSSSGKSVSTTDTLNNVYVATEMASTNMLLLRKYSENFQNIIWTQWIQYGSNGNVKSLHFTDNGNLYINSGEGSTPIILRINANDGSVVWKKKFSNSNSPEINSLEEDATATSIYVVGKSWRADVGTGTQLAFISRLSVSDGTAQWDRGCTSLGSETHIFEDVTIMDGYIYAAGYLRSGSYHRPAVVKFDSLGQIVALRQVPQPTPSIDARFHGIVNDGTYIYAVGRSPNAAWISRWDDSFTSNINKFHGFGAEDPGARDIYLGSDDNLYVIFAGSADFYFSDPSGFVIGRFDKTTLELTGAADTRRFITENGTINSIKRYFNGKGSKITLDYPGGHLGQYSYTSVQFDITQFLSLSGSKYLNLYSEAGSNSVTSDVDDNLTTTSYDTDGSWSDATSVQTNTAQTTVNVYTDTEYTPAVESEGGLVWIKGRNTTTNHALYDTVRGSNILSTNVDSFQSSTPNGVNLFNSTGFNMGDLNAINSSGDPFASWTWRKMPKFFDVVFYNGNDVTGISDSVAHNLGSRPGMIVVKSLNQDSNWAVWHRGNGTDDLTQLSLDNNLGAGSQGALSFTPDENVFYPYYIQNTNGNRQNNPGTQYIAYLFAHNDGDGIFGESRNEDIIKCGVFTGTLKTASVDLGFEPQWLLTKRIDSNSSEGWEIFDHIRGMPFNASDKRLFTEQNIAEEVGQNSINLRADGFDIEDNIDSGGEYLYVAIRRPMAIPNNGEDVFDAKYYQAANQSNPRTHITGLDYVDAAMFNITSGPSGAGNSALYDRKVRLYEDYFLMYGPSGMGGSDTVEFDHQNKIVTDPIGSHVTTNYSTNLYRLHMWKRAPGFCDTVAYFGNGSTLHNIPHGLGVEPEMVWMKSLNTINSYGDWIIWHKDLPGTYPSTRTYMQLNNPPGTITSYQPFFAAPTSTQLSLNADVGANQSSQPYAAYLFASLNGVSKVGSYTGDDTLGKVIDCGFDSGARFIWIKPVASAYDYVFDFARGIVSGVSPHIQYGETTVEDTATDQIDPHPSGFRVSQNTTHNLNLSGREYLFWAIA